MESHRHHRRRHHHQQQRRQRRQSFDVIIIGAGPSAAGLLHGLLTLVLAGELNIRIAIMERGAVDLNYDAAVVLDDEDDESHNDNKEAMHEYPKGYIGSN